MNVYLSQAGHWDLVLLEKLLDGYIQAYKIESDVLLENSLFIVEPDHMHQLLQIRPDIANIKNKKLLIIHHHKSMSHAIDPDSRHSIELFEKLGFKHKNIYVITQLEYDKEFILKHWPGVNVLAYDRWLIQLFDRQVTRLAYGDITNVWYQSKETNSLTMKRFCIFIRRPEENRFEFMCQLIANNILDNCNYTFVNHTPHGASVWTREYYKQLIPQQLEYSRPKIESWLNGIPYEIKMTTTGGGLIEFHDYPYGIEEYFNNSKINIVFETEPTNHSFITEKTYKAILYKKPFIIVTQCHGLKALRDSGYQTFGHVIDESYDDIEDYNERIEAILKEIIRLNNLPELEFDNLVNSCMPMIEHNHSHLYSEAYKYIPEEFRIKSLTTF
jgi:hypothetical protein